jgi:hypothetical protein
MGLPTRVVVIVCVVGGFVLAVVVLSQGASLGWRPWTGNPFGG